MKPRGFTLVETLIVLIIIGVLTAIAFSAHFKKRNNLRDSKVKSEQMFTVMDAAEDFRFEHGRYPKNVAELVLFLPDGELLPNVFSGVKCEPSGSANPGASSYIFKPNAKATGSFEIRARDHAGNVFNQVLRPTAPPTWKRSGL